MTPPGPRTPSPIDPFDLPDHLGSGRVTWSADDGVSGRCRVRGSLVSTDGAAAVVPCDLLAVDDAYPMPVIDDLTRAAAHQAWQHGQVHLVACEQRLTLLVPGTRFGAELALEAVRRLVKALGARPADFTVSLRLTD